MSSEKTESCHGCGATVYPEHLETGIAKRLDGKLLCSHCVKEKQTTDSGEVLCTVLGSTGNLHSPLNTGFRFSMKAMTPSRWSCV